MLRIYLVRHGESTANRAGVYAGVTDAPLTEAGRRQAVRLGARFQGVRLDAVVTSDLRRAADTARGIVEALGSPVPVMTDPRLRELHFGAWEGRTFADVTAEGDEAFWRWWMGGEGGAPPGGESWKDLAARVGAVVDEWQAAAPGETVVFVTHGGPIRAAVARALALSWHGARRLQIDNASVSRLDVYAEETIVGFLNDTHHLRDP